MVDVAAADVGARTGHEATNGSGGHSAKVRASLHVNGTEHELLISPESSLVDVLRYDLGLTGTKRACNEGECASCSVLVDGKVVNSCLTPAADLAGAEITTVEGLARNGTPDPVQAAFASHFASQCGYCTPGMVMTAKALLAEHPHPSEDEIRQGIRGNLCRCTGYAKIVEAIKAAAGEQTEHVYRASEHEVVGHPVARIDALEKVTGRAPYANDVTLPGMVYGEILRSPLAHARITRLDVTEARSLPGVMAVLTQQDMPPAKFGAFAQDETALADGVVRHVGEGIAAVIATSEQVALRAMELIEVDYDELPVVTDPEQAMADGAPQLHPDTERNVVAHNRVVGGDVEAGFADADYVFEDRYETSRQCHVCLEPHAVVADWDVSDKVTLWMSSQSTFFDRAGLMGVFGLPANKIRIICPYLGGGFGSKSETHSIYIVAMVASRVTGRPVKMFHSRDEEFTSSRTRHPEIIYLKTGLKADGTITARQARVILNNGAYTSYGPGVSLTQSMLGGAVYKIPNYRYDGYTVYTNTPVGGAFRGFGSPQFTFAAEVHTDMLAERLGMDPVEFRLKNLSEPGDVAVSGPTLTTCGIRECLTKAAEAIGWKDKHGKGGNRGVGISCGTHFTSGKFHPHLNADFCGASVKVNPDGSVTLLIGAVEMGTGAATTAVAQICAQELGVTVGDVQVITSDSETIPADFGTYGSRVTTLSGNAVRLACEQVRDQLLHFGAEALETTPDKLELREGRVQSAADPGTGMSLSDVATSALFRDRDGRQIMAMAHYDAPCDLPDPETGVGDFAQSYSFGVHAVEVEVDEETGHVKVVNFVAATDCGNVINPALAESQVEGGAVQGLGYALMEDLVCDENGQVLNPRLSGYRIPTATEIPPITSLWVETDDPRGPYGAKGLAEMGLVPTAAAVSNAIHDAAGVRLQRIPMTPQRVLDAIEDAATAGGRS